jgi:hypothetical protein
MLDNRNDEDWGLQHNGQVWQRKGQVLLYNMKGKFWGSGIQHDGRVPQNMEKDQNIFMDYAESRSSRTGLTCWPWHSTAWRICLTFKHIWLFPFKHILLLPACRGTCRIHYSPQFLHICWNALAVCVPPGHPLIAPCPLLPGAPTMSGLNHTPPLIPILNVPYLPKLKLFYPATHLSSLFPKPSHAAWELCQLGPRRKYRELPL